MKTYRLKNNYYNGIKLYRKGVTVYKFDRDYHYSDNGDDDTFINSAIVENNPDIFEKVEEKPKYEVGDWVKTNCNKVGKITGLNGTGMESIFVEGTGWIYESQIKCKVKPVKLWFNVYKEKGEICYRFGSNVLYESKEVATQNLFDKTRTTHSITIYEEVEE